MKRKGHRTFLLATTAAVAALPLVAYIAGYYLLPARSMDLSIEIPGSPPFIHRYYKAPWMVTVFRPASHVEAWLRHGVVEIFPYPPGESDEKSAFMAKRQNYSTADYRPQWARPKP